MGCGKGKGVKGMIKTSDLQKPLEGSPQHRPPVHTKHSWAASSPGAFSLAWASQVLQTGCSFLMGGGSGWGQRRGGEKALHLPLSDNLEVGIQTHTEQRKRNAGL